MVMFSVNTHRFDPYKDFKFRVKWDGQIIPGISKVSSLYNIQFFVLTGAGDVLVKNGGKVEVKTSLMRVASQHFIWRLLFLVFCVACCSR